MARKTTQNQGSQTSVQHWTREPAKTPGDTTTRKKRSMGEVKSDEQNSVAEESEVKAEVDTTPPTTKSETTDAKKGSNYRSKDCALCPNRLCRGRRGGGKENLYPGPSAPMLGRSKRLSWRRTPLL